MEDRAEFTAQTSQLCTAERERLPHSDVIENGERQIAWREGDIYSSENLPREEIVRAQLLARRQVLIALPPVIAAVGILAKKLELEGAAGALSFFRRRRTDQDPFLTRHLSKMATFLEKHRQAVPLGSRVPKIRALSSPDELMTMHYTDSKGAERDFDRIVMASHEYAAAQEKLWDYFGADIPESWEAIPRKFALTRAFKAFHRAGIEAHHIPTAATQGLSSGPLGLTFLLRAANRELIRRGIVLHYLPDRNISVAKIERFEVAESPEGRFLLLSVKLSPDAHEQMAEYFETFNPEANAVLLYTSGEKSYDGLTHLKEIGATGIAELSRVFKGSSLPTQAHGVRHAINHQRYGAFNYRASSLSAAPIETLFSSGERELLGPAGNQTDGEFLKLDELAAFGSGIAASTVDRSSNRFQEFALLVSTFLGEAQYDLCHRLLIPVLLGAEGVRDDEIPVIQAFLKLDERFKRAQISVRDAQTIAATMETLGELGMERLSDIELFSRGGIELEGIKEENEVNV